jgi:hypothetical protein
VGQKIFEITDKVKNFIEKQKIFFVATAAEDGRVNVSPKGMDAFRIIDKNRIVWLNVTGSGNETAAHAQENNRMTLLFLAFEGEPMILRLYGQAKTVHQHDVEWQDLSGMFTMLPGARQFFDVTIDFAQTSCGMAVPFFNYGGDRNQLNEWAVKKGEVGLQEYWREKNQHSIDGKPTNIVPNNR